MEKTQEQQDQQFISIEQLLEYKGTSRQEEEIKVKGDSMVEISICDEKKFWITPLNVSINK